MQQGSVRKHLASIERESSYGGSRIPEYLLAESHWFQNLSWILDSRPLGHTQPSPACSLSLGLPVNLGPAVLGPLLANVPLGPLLGSSRLSSKSAKKEVTSTTVRERQVILTVSTTLRPSLCPCVHRAHLGSVQSSLQKPLMNRQLPHYPHPGVLLVSPGIPHWQLLYSQQRRKMKGF